MKISVVGSGYVGLVAGTCFADLGNDVICIDKDRQKITKLKQGKPIIFEQGLKDLMEINIREKRLHFTTNIKQAIRDGEVIFIAVGTPPGKDHRADLTAVKEVAADIGRYLQDYKVIVNKSTVPVGTADLVFNVIQAHQKHPIPFDVVSNPEFMREGYAIQDFLNPDRIIVGTDSERARKVMEQIYRGIVRTGKPMMVTDIKSAEMIKYASNAFLATKISFINEVAQLCERVGADVKEVAKGMGLDERIGARFLQAGAGYGGSCFPKDVRALMFKGKEYNVPFVVLEAAEKVNMEARDLLIRKLKKVYPKLKGKTIAVWGLAFKPMTDDMREAPSITIIQKLQSLGVNVVAFDPVAEENARKILQNVQFRQKPYDAVIGCDALIIITEWNEFRVLDLKKIKSLMKQPVIIDGRNVYEPKEMNELGFTYFGVGR